MFASIAYVYVCSSPERLSISPNYRVVQNKAPWNYQYVVLKPASEIKFLHKFKVSNVL